MCDSGCIDFGERVLDINDVYQKDVLEVGSLDMNGSLRTTITGLGPKSYIGVDLVPGDGVDKIVGVEDIVERFGRESFDIVVSTEMLEHVKDWRLAVTNMKEVLKPRGILIVTTRSFGCPKHDYPNDYWRFEVNDFKHIFNDMFIINLEKDPTNLSELPGVFIKAVKFDLSDYEVYGMDQ